MKQKMFTVVPLIRVKTAEETYMSNKQKCLQEKKKRRKPQHSKN